MGDNWENDPDSISDHYLSGPSEESLEHDRFNTYDGYEDDYEDEYYYNDEEIDYEPTREYKNHYRKNINSRHHGVENESGETKESKNLESKKESSSSFASKAITFFAWLIGAKILFFIISQMN